MTITSRRKDEIDGTIVYSLVGGGGALFNFHGTVNGTTLKLVNLGGGPENFQCVYYPAAKTITGVAESRSFTFRLSPAEE
jgi:hypothetical protein